MFDCCFNVNLDVYDNRMLDVAEISRLRAEQEVMAVGNEEAVALLYTFFFMLYDFALLTPPHHLCSPITMRHLALLSYS